ncbi:efflux RND transporter periplasmic adaptor subunit [Siculibacillus lacustris]|uniref:Efflux RND transporter periplasmic adaptor subunit n=1 Tax=Siculibacillus lacustris TaxID=1549641 RepID=A0A4Q9VWF7_9HYPH|nr:efflux RND transporter periplasmic adaptor subunit [Siculibacillus lacustris]TBW40652.1 efflux RND transporter periplasmic adaptor subunit [Siculibacillus lacustris]
MRSLFPILALLIATTPAVAGEFVVHAQRIDDRKVVIATVEPVHQVLARARIGGTVIRLDVKEGDRVEAGAAVAVVADQKIALQISALDARILSAQAQRDQARINLTRGSELQKTGAVATAAVDQARTNLDVAERTLTALKADRDVLTQQAVEGTVAAPTSGRVLTVAVTEGAVTMPGETIATLAEDQYILRLALPERHAAILRAGDGVDIAPRGGTTVATRGRVRTVYPEIRGGRVIADVEVAGLGDYFVGERTRVYVRTGERSALFVPPAALISRAGIDLLRLKSGAEIVVQTGELRAEGLEILSGLSDGDVVVAP